MGFPGSSDSKESTCNAGNMGSTRGLGRSPGGGHGNPLQYSCLGNPMDRGAWQATVHRLTRDGRNLVTEQPHTHRDFYWFYSLENANTLQKLNQTSVCVCVCVCVLTHTYTHFIGSVCAKLLQVLHFSLYSPLLLQDFQVSYNRNLVSCKTTSIRNTQKITC